MSECNEILLIDLNGDPLYRCEEVIGGSIRGELRDRCNGVAEPFNLDGQQGINAYSSERPTLGKSMNENLLHTSRCSERPASCLPFASGSDQLGLGTKPRSSGRGCLQHLCGCTKIPLDNREPSWQPLDKSTPGSEGGRLMLKRKITHFTLFEG